VSAYSLALRLVGIGWFISSSVVIGLLGGMWLDNKTDSSPLFVLSGIGLGLLVSGYSIYKTLAYIIRHSDTNTAPLKEDDQEEGG